VGEAVSAVLPPAIAVAISPIPIIAVILMLFTSRARVKPRSSPSAWQLGLLVVAGVAYLVSDSADVARDEDAANGAFALRATLGVLLVLLALRQWRGRLGGPVLSYLAAGKRAEESLSELKTWLDANNATVMAVLLIIGISLLSDGLQGLFA
jgi:O-antigen/teichoic acid export membrane protein